MQRTPALVAFSQNVAWCVIGLALKAGENRGGGCGGVRGGERGGGRG